MSSFNLRCKTSTTPAGAAELEVTGIGLLASARIELEDYYPNSRHSRAELLKILYHEIPQEGDVLEKNQINR